MRPSHAPLVHMSRLLPAVMLCGCHVSPLDPPVAPVGSRDSVAVGYGSQDKRDLTGSISTLSGDMANRSSPTTLADMLDGRFAGVEVRRLANGGLSVRIRGQRTFKGDAEPLYVVDGVPQHPGLNGVFTDIDPRDVKSIDVLKDAGATAVYGSRGANGVILISTRRPEN